MPDKVILYYSPIYIIYTHQFILYILTNLYYIYSPIYIIYTHQFILYILTNLYYIYLPIYIMYTWVRFHKTAYYIYSSVLLIETLNALQRRFFWLQRLSENRLNFSYMSNPRPRAIVQPVSVLIRRSWSALKS